MSFQINHENEPTEWSDVARWAGSAIDKGSRKGMMRALLHILLAAEARVRADNAKPPQVPTGEEQGYVLPAPVRKVQHKVNGHVYDVLLTGTLCISDGNGPDRKQHTFTDGEPLTMYCRQEAPYLLPVVYFRRPEEIYDTERFAEVAR